MLIERTVKFVILYAKRKLSRQRPVLVLVEYACIAFAIALIAYLITFNVIIYPFASFMFRVSGRTAAVYQARARGEPLEKATFATGASSINSTHEQYLRNKYLNYAALPMRRPEADLMLSYLKSTDVYLEFGASATSLAFPYFVRQSFTIEHDVRVCEGIALEMRKHDDLSAKLRAFCAPVPTGRAGWGRVSQFEEGTYKAFRNYVDFPRSNLSHIMFDKVLINGRARVACALRILSQLTPDSVVFFHDYLLRPAHYSAVLTFYDELARVVAHGPVDGYTDDPMGMLVLRPKREYLGDAAEVSLARINGIYESYVETAPTAKSTSTDVAFRNGLLPTDKGGFPYYQLSRQMRYETTVMRIILDVILLPCVALTYLLLQAIFRRVFMDILASSSSRSARLFSGDLRAASLWTSLSSSQGTSTNTKLLPTTVTGNQLVTEPPVGKAE